MSLMPRNRDINAEWDEIAFETLFQWTINHIRIETEIRKVVVSILTLSCMGGGEDV